MVGVGLLGYFGTGRHMGIEYLQIEFIQLLLAKKVLSHIPVALIGG